MHGLDLATESGHHHAVSLARYKPLELIASMTPISIYAGRICYVI